MSQSIIEKVTINDLDKQDYIAVKTRFFHLHRDTLCKYFSWAERRKLENLSFSWFFLFVEKKFVSKYDCRIPTHICYSKRNVDIPVEFHVVMSAIQKKDLNTQGLFRIGGITTEINRIEKELKRMLDENVGTAAMIEVLVKENVRELCTLFTRLFDMFQTTLFPRNLLKIALDIYHIDDENDRWLCFKALIFGFPYYKRNLFESIAYFVNYLNDKNSVNDPEHLRSLNLNGICKVITPKVFLYKNEVHGVHLIFEYAELLDFMFRHMEEILGVDCPVQ